MKVSLMLDNSPNTAMILGAALSGGDAIGLARQMSGEGTEAKAVSFLKPSTLGSTRKSPEEGNPNEKSC